MNGKTCKIDLADYMTTENQLEFIRLLYEHAENYKVTVEVGGKQYVLQLNPDLNPPRSLDSK